MNYHGWTISSALPPARFSRHRQRSGRPERSLELRRGEIFGPEFIATLLQGLHELSVSWKRIAIFIVVSVSNHDCQSFVRKERKAVVGTRHEGARRCRTASSQSNQRIHRIHQISFPFTSVFTMRESEGLFARSYDRIVVQRSRVLHQSRTKLSSRQLPIHHLDVFIFKESRPRISRPTPLFGARLHPSRKFYPHERIERLQPFAPVQRVQTGVVRLDRGSPRLDGRRFPERHRVRVRHRWHDGGSTAVRGERETR